MVRIKWVVAIVVIIIAGILAWQYFIRSEERKIKRQFNLLSEYVSKEPGESVFTMANKIQGMKTLFTESCRVEADNISLSGSYTPDEIGSYAVQARLQFSRLSLKFYDPEITFPERNSARVVLTARVTGNYTAGESIDETHELEVLLEKAEKKYLFKSFTVTEVLKK
jgi:hypothetical protein